MARPEADTKTVAVGSFKTNCLTIIDGVHSKREPVVITKHGRPVAKLVPMSLWKGEIYNFLVGKGCITGDIV